jgi:hypothetical protein
MTENELKNLIEHNIDDSLNYINEVVQPERTQALDFYLRKPYGNEVLGKSSIVTSEVSEAVHGALPQLMKVFTQSEDAVDFLPVGSGDATTAENITHYVNHIFHKDNPGAIILHNWMFDALVQKVGIVKAYWNKDITVTHEKYQGLSEEELTQLAQSDDVEIEEQEANVVQDAQVDPNTGQQMPPVFSYDVKLKIRRDNSKVKIENVPPEEFLINKRATSVSDASFVAQRQILTRSDLVSMGYDKQVINDLTTDDILGFDGHSINRQEYEFANEDSSGDRSQEYVTYYECYLDVGKADGTAEKRRICYASNTILADEECDYVPFYSLCPFPIPHQFFGHSLADKTMDLQSVKSTITRQMLDNLYLTNNSRIGVVEGQVNIDDVLTSTAGGVIRMKNPAGIVPLTVQSSAGQSFPMLQYLDEVSSKRTGVSDLNQGLDANVLQNVSATAVATMTAQSQGKLELIARVFADTGIKNIFQGILQLVCKYQDKERMMRINNKPTVIDPREWDELYDVSINVGLGNGTKDEKVSMLGMVLSKQEQILQQYGLSNPLVTLKQYRETLAKFINASGYKDDIAFLNEITDEQSQQLAQQDAEADKTAPEVKAAQAVAEAEQMKAQLQAQTKMQEMQMKQEFESQKLELQRMQQEIDSAKAMLEIETERAKLKADMIIEEAKLQQKTDDSDMKNIVNAVDKLRAMN